MNNWFQTLRKTRRVARRCRFVATLEALDPRCLLDAGAAYAQVALVSDIQGLAPNLDPNLQNPWGFSETPDGQFRVSDNASGLATLYNAEGAIVGAPVTIPVPPGVKPPAAPNGNIANTTNYFRYQRGRQERSGDRPVLDRGRHDRRLEPAGRPEERHHRGRPVPVRRCLQAPGRGLGQRG